MPAGVLPASAVRSRQAKERLLPLLDELFSLFHHASFQSLFTLSTENPPAMDLLVHSSVPLQVHAKEAGATVREKTSCPRPTLFLATFLP